MYGYAHAAEEAQIPLAPYPAVRSWIARLEALPGFANDLAPYPPNAAPGAGGRSTTRPRDRLRCSRATAAHASAYLGSLAEPAASPRPCAAAELRRRLARPLTDAGVAAADVVDDLVRDVDGGLIGSAGPRFFGWVVGGTLPAALAADWLVSTWDQNACIYATSPASAIVEEVAGTWLLDLLGLPPDASIGFVTGTQLAHVTALAAARSHLLAQRGHDVERLGLSGAPPGASGGRALITSRRSRRPAARPRHRRARRRRPPTSRPHRPAGLAATSTIVRPSSAWRPAT